MKDYVVILIQMRRYIRHIIILIMLNQYIMMIIDIIIADNEDHHHEPSGELGNVEQGDPERRE